MARNWSLRGDVKKYAVLNGHLFFFIMHGSLIHLYEPKEKTQRALACVCYDGHAYFLKSARSVSNWDVREEFAKASKIIMKNGHKTCLPPISEWRQWQGVVGPGYFYTHQCLSLTRKQLLEQGRSCKLSLKDLQGIGA